MPGLEGDLEEWQTQEVNVTRGEAEGDIDLEGLPFLKVTRGPRHYLFCYSRQFYFFMHILIFTISIKTLVFVGDKTTRSITIYLYYSLVFSQLIQSVPLPLVLTDLVND